MAKAPKGKSSTGDGTAKAPEVVSVDPTSDEALWALPVKLAEAPDIPVATAQLEAASLATLAREKAAAFAAIGIPLSQIDVLARFATRLGELERAWQTARRAVKLTAAERAQLIEAEALDSKLLAGGRWACRKDPDAQQELDRIAEGSGLADTVQDLIDEVAFWGTRAAERKHTDITDADLARATELAAALKPAAGKEGSDSTAATALELRNRCFWATEAAAREVREGGRYAFSKKPKVAALFVSRYRAAASRRSRKSAKGNGPPMPIEPPEIEGGEDEAEDATLEAQKPDPAAAKAAPKAPAKPRAAATPAAAPKGKAKVAAKGKAAAKKAAPRGRTRRR